MKKEQGSTEGKTRASTIHIERLKSILNGRREQPDSKPQQGVCEKNFVLSVDRFKVTLMGVMNAVLLGTAWFSFRSCAEATIHMVVFPGNTRLSG